VRRYNGNNNGNNQPNDGTAWRHGSSAMVNGNGSGNGPWSAIQGKREAKLLLF
jgi:hypothetical protein